jgi:hypothetical protein
MPALAAWTAYLLCRRLTGSFWASLVGGYLYGFSGSVVREQAWGNLHVTAIFLLPLIALAVVRYVEHELSGGGLVWRLGVLIACQLLISTEFALTATVMLALGLVLAFALVRDVRPRLLSSLRPVVAGYVLGGVLTAPFLAYAVLGFVPSSFVPIHGSGSDVLNLVVPTQAIAAGGSALTGITSRLPDGGIGLYLGLPTLAIIAAYGARTRRASWTRVLLAALAVATVAALGTDLAVDGHRLVPFVWAAIAHLPGLSNALPYRFGAYASLAAAVIVALWTAGTRGRLAARPFVLPALAVAALVPAFWQPRFHERPDRPAFFSEARYKTCVPRGETLLIFPFGGGGYSLLWQAEADFWFRMAEDGLQPEPKDGKALNTFDADPLVWDLHYVDYASPTMDSLLGFSANHHVDRIVTKADSDYPSRAQLRTLAPTELDGGVYVAPACGRPSLLRRDLQSYARKLLDVPNIGYCVGGSFEEIPATLYPSGALAGSKPANYVAGQGLTCAGPPAGYTRHGFATADLGVPANVYPLYTR